MHDILLIEHLEIQEKAISNTRSQYFFCTVLLILLLMLNDSTETLSDTSEQQQHTILSLRIMPHAVVNDSNVHHTSVSRTTPQYLEQHLAHHYHQYYHGSGNG